MHPVLLWVGLLHEVSGHCFPFNFCLCVLWMDARNVVPYLSEQFSFPQFQAGSEQCDVIFLFTCFNSSGSCLSNVCAGQKKLVRFSLHFMGSYILLCIGWFSSFLNYAAFTSTSVFFLLSRFSRPISVSMAWIGADLWAPAVILDAWFCTLLTLSKFDFDAVPQIPHAWDIHVLCVLFHFHSRWELSSLPPVLLLGCIDVTLADSVLGPHGT